MLCDYSHYKYFNSSSVGTVFWRQNLTSIDVRFWRLKTVPALKQLPYNSRVDWQGVSGIPSIWAASFQTEKWITFLGNIIMIIYHVPCLIDQVDIVIWRWPNVVPMLDQQLLCCPNIGRTNCDLRFSFTKSCQIHHVEYIEKTFRQRFLCICRCMLTIDKIIVSRFQFQHVQIPCSNKAINHLIEWLLTSLPV